MKYLFKFSSSCFDLSACVLLSFNPFRRRENVTPFWNFFNVPLLPVAPFSFPLAPCLLFIILLLFCYAILYRPYKGLIKPSKNRKIYGDLGKGGQKFPVSGCLQVGWGALYSNTRLSQCSGQWPLAPRTRTTRGMSAMSAFEKECWDL